MPRSLPQTTPRAEIPIAHGPGLRLPPLEALRRGPRSLAINAAQGPASETLHRTGLPPNANKRTLKRRHLPAKERRTCVYWNGPFGSYGVIRHIKLDEIARTLEFRSPTLDHIGKTLGRYFDEAGIAALGCPDQQVNEAIYTVAGGRARPIVKAGDSVKESLETPISLIEDHRSGKRSLQTMRHQDRAAIMLQGVILAGFSSDCNNAVTACQGSALEQ